MTLDQALKALEAARVYDPRRLCRDDIPITPGVYLWSRRSNGNPASIGRALGSGGLRGRIWRQHLNPGWLENRLDRITKDDWYQRAHAIVKNGRLHIDKSRLRCNIGRDEHKAPSQTLDFIRKRLRVAWICPLRSEIERLEDELKAYYRARGFSLYNRR